MAVSYFVENSRTIGTDASNNKVVWVEIWVDNTGALPAANDLTGHIFVQGSKAHCIADASEYRLNSSGTWILQKADSILRQGELIPEYADLNDYDTAGTYYSNNAARTATLYNRPWTGSGFKLIVWSISGTSKQQWVMPMSQSAHSIYIRNHVTSGWKDWYEIAGTLTATINPYP